MIEVLFARPLWLLMLIPAAAVIVIMTVCSRRPRRRGLWAAAALQLSAAVFLSFAAGGLYVRRQTDRERTVILLDASESTSGVRGDMTDACRRLTGAFGADVVLFGADCAAGLGAGVDASGTDISAALAHAASLLPDGGRIILLSDGRETVGNAAEAVCALPGQSIRVDAVFVSPENMADSEVVLRSLTASGGAFAGDTLTLTVTAAASRAMDATLTLYDGDRQAERRTVALAAGDNTILFDCAVDAGGAHTFRVGIEASGDAESRNNSLTVSVVTADRPNVMLIAPDEGQAQLLAEVLRASCDVTVRTEGEVPVTLESLCPFDAFFLLNCDAGRLPAGFGEMLEVLSRDYGKYVCLVGGEDTFSRGGMAGTVYESMLPVSFGASDGKPAALLLVLDASGSMVAGRDNRLEEAKLGAIRVVQSLPSFVQVGVISFSDDAAVESPLVRATPENKELLTRLISAIGRRSGTAFLPALDSASALLGACGDGMDRHILFLSDGRPSDSQSSIMHRIDDMSAAGISLGVVAIRESGDDVSFLRRMAEHGNGGFSTVDSGKSPVAGMLAESERVSGTYLVRVPFVPAVTDPAWAGVDASLPAVGGYVVTTAREGAHVILASERGDPLYAVWDRGIGKAACFTSDLAQGMCDAFLSSDAGRDFVLRALFDGLPDVRYTSPQKADTPAAAVNAEYDTLRPGDPALLRGITQDTGGTFAEFWSGDGVQTVIMASRPVRTVETSLTLPLCAAACAALLGGIIVRKRERD